LVNAGFFALDHAMESVVASGGPLVPFAVITVGGETKLYRFPGDMAEGQAKAREMVSGSGASMAAVAWDGFLTVDGQRTDAVFAEAFEAGDPESILLAQRYERSGRIRKSIHPTGNAALAGRNASLL
jgi:hypothetical protein